MDGTKKERLIKAIVKEFQTSLELRNWISLKLSVNPATIIAGGLTFDQEVLAVLNWSEATGSEADVLQLLADSPPNDGRDLLLEIFYASDGAIRRTGSRGAPVLAVDDWFVTQRPIADRDPLRTALRTLATAQNGADSVLVIAGEKRTGKSHGIRLAASSAPPNQHARVDTLDWTATQIYAWDLAGAIYPPGLVELENLTFDPTKEDSKVPWLLTWLKGKLAGKQTWILLDHCNRPNLTKAAESLIYQLINWVDEGKLPNVRLIVADVDQDRLPRAFMKRGRWDIAGLPDREAVGTWITSLAKHLGKPCDEVKCREYLDEVFEGTEAVPESGALADVIESRLTDVFRKLGGPGGS